MTFKMAHVVYKNDTWNNIILIELRFNVEYPLINGIVPTPRWLF